MIYNPSLPTNYRARHRSKSIKYFAISILYISLTKTLADHGKQQSHLSHQFRSERSIVAN